MKIEKSLDLSPEDLKAVMERIRNKNLEPHDYVILEALGNTFILLSQSLNDKETSIRRLLRLIFGPTTERSKDILKNQEQEQSQNNQSTEPSTQNRQEAKEPKTTKHPGHGRNGANDYPGADRVKVAHQTLKPGDTCPGCSRGKVYRLKDWGIIIRFVAKAPIEASVFELEKLRCNCCGEVFTASAPPQAGTEKYDETVPSMVALMKYGNGFPFHRLEKLQESCGIPLAASTQWEIVEKRARHLSPIYDEFIRQAAQGEIIHNDDTTAKIISMMKDNSGNGEPNDPSRKGLFTTGIISIMEDKKIALFFTGRNHAGENLDALLEKRQPDLDLPIQMCDALSRNIPKKFKTLLCNCLTHARRNFVDIIPSFPENCRFVIETLAKVYHNDDIAKQQKMSPQQRLKFHQENSGPLMDQLRDWGKTQSAEKKVEPNSGLGKALSYLIIRHWEQLTLFLRVPNAPLDNNIVERALKMVLLNRKNSYFFRSERGAFVGDLFMSLIHTCHLAGTNAFDYLTTLFRNPQDSFKNPQLWMPWNYNKPSDQRSP